MRFSGRPDEYNGVRISKKKINGRSYLIGSDCLRREIERPRSCSVGWSFAIDPYSGKGIDLEVVHGRAPAQRSESEVTAFVALRAEPTPVPILMAGPVWNCPLTASMLDDVAIGYMPCGAHCDDDRDDKAVYHATHALLDIVVAENPAVETLHFEFSGENGTVPPVYGFIEAVRTFRAWRADRHGGGLSLPRLNLYVQSDVELCLTSGRIDIRELLASELIRFWVVIISGADQEPVRHAMHLCPRSGLKEVLDLVGVPADSPRWSVSVCPSPRKKTLQANRGGTAK